ncbi:MAG: DUF2155 domain-containing protein [Alphaproteobacteria bacterium]|nr:DUF2155 domain-containing protein [Alphaproteobacteria bacterium]
MMHTQFSFTRKCNKPKIGSSISFTLMTLLFFNISYLNANIVELPNDSLPWLQGNKTTSTQQNTNTSSGNNVQQNAGQDDHSNDRTGKTDPRAKSDLPPDSPEAILIDEPANKHGFVVDRLLEHNYIPQDYAVLKILDKVTAKTFTVEAKVNNPFKFGWIEVTVKSAKKTPPEEEPEAVAFIEVFAQQPMKKSEHVFSGFIFASSPSVSAIEHPRYDIRLFDCLTDEDLKKQAEAEAKKKEDEKKAEEDKKNGKVEKKDAKNKDSKDKKKKDKNTPNKQKNKTPNSGSTYNPSLNTAPAQTAPSQPQAAGTHDTD